MKNKRLLIMFAIVLVDMLSFSIVLPLMPYLSDSLGASRLQTGLLTAMYPLAQLFAAPVLGRLSDRVGRKPVLLVSVAGTMLGFIVLATARTLPILFISRFMDGVTGGNISVAQAYIADVTDPKDRGQALGLIGAAFGLGFILGPATGGALSQFGYAVPVLLGAALAGVNLLLIAFVLPESLTAEDKARLAARVRKGSRLSALREAMGHRRVGPLLSIRFLTGISFGMFESGFALWAIAALSLTARANGFVLAYVGVLSVLVQAFLIKRLTARYTDDRLLLTSLCIAAVALLAWGYVPTLWLLIAIMPALSVGLAVSNTIMTSALTKAVHHDEVGGMLGLQTSIQSFTRIPAPIMAAGLLQYGAVWSPGVTASLLTLGAAGVAFSKLCVRPGRDSCDGGPELEND